MSKHGKVPLFIALFTLTLVVAISLYARVEKSLAQEMPQEPEAELPIADYNAPEPADKEKREKRRAKGEKYKNDRPIDPKIGEMSSTVFDHWFYGLTPLPTTRSEAVVIGEVIDAKAYLSPDKSAVYSEYTVRINEVLKTNDAAIVPACTVDAQRLSGRVRLPSGQIQKYEVSGLGVPRIGRKYALFLVRYQQDLVILTGYELHQNKVRPLDSVQMFQVYKNMDVQTFMDTLRQAIITPQTPPRNEYLMSPVKTLHRPNRGRTQPQHPARLQHPAHAQDHPAFPPKRPTSNRIKNIKLQSILRAFLKRNWMPSSAVSNSGIL